MLGRHRVNDDSLSTLVISIVYCFRLLLRIDQFCLVFRVHSSFDWGFRGRAGSHL